MLFGWNKDLKKILIIGSGPIIIGQAAEFDYAGTQACLALKEEGYAAVKVDDYVSGTKIVEEDGEKKVEHVTIYYYASKDDATAAMEKIQKLSNEKKGENSDWVGATQSGSMIYFGTKAAIKAAK